MSSPETPNNDNVAASIGAGAEKAKSESARDDTDEATFLDLQAIRRQNELLNVHIGTIRSDQALRKDYASKILKFLIAYVSVLGLMVILAALEVEHPTLRWITFSLPDNVLLVLVTSAAALSIGVVGFIARGLFKDPPGIPDDLINRK